MKQLYVNITFAEGSQLAMKLGTSSKIRLVKIRISHEYRTMSIGSSIDCIRAYKIWYYLDNGKHLLHETIHYFPNRNNLDLKFDKVLLLDSIWKKWEQLDKFEKVLK